MKHLSDGALRRMLDRPDSLDDQAKAHLQSCERCRDRASGIVSTANSAAALMEAGGKVSVDPAPALQALRSRGLSSLSPASAPRWRSDNFSARRYTRPVLAVAMVAILGMTLVGTGVAASLIKIFEPEQVVAVPVDLDTLNSLPDLSRYGTFAFGQEPMEQQAANLQEAAQRTGLRLLAPS
ncbi:MAG TPA: hypothetical protein VHJ78_10110, partial [Actinomycetota bacterium]|nr:hypothetical protein [Actinomycetota bacterium]